MPEERQTENPAGSPVAQDAGLSREQTDGRINYLYHKKPAELTRPEYDDICKRMDDTARELRNGGNKQ